MDMKITFPGGSKVDAQYKGFTIKTDQPISGGGDQTAPAPFDMFLASIATCAGIYLLRFVEQRGMAAKDFELSMRTEKDPEKRMLSKIIIEVKTPDTFPVKYTNALTRAINLCAVKKHMHDPPEFETNVYCGDAVAT
jgi:putative redox protein